MSDPRYSHAPAGAFADGAPVGAARPAPYMPPGATPIAAAPRAEAPRNVVTRTTDTVTRIRAVEGLRGYSVRAATLARHGAYAVGIIGSVAVTSWAFSANPTWRFGGTVMLYGIATILVASAIGSILYADCREEISKQWRHFVFGIMAFPGMALALFMRLVIRAFDNPSGSSDVFASLLTGNGLPLAYFAMVVIPPIIYLKYIFGGLRSVNRSAMTDEEQMATWLRQDGYQR